MFRFEWLQKKIASAYDGTKENESPLWIPPCQRPRYRLRVRRPLGRRAPYRTKTTRVSRLVRRFLLSRRYSQFLPNRVQYGPAVFLVFGCNSFFVYLRVLKCVLNKRETGNGIAAALNHNRRRLRTLGAFSIQDLSTSEKRSLSSFHQALPACRSLAFGRGQSGGDCTTCRVRVG